MDKLKYLKSILALLLVSTASFCAAQKISTSVDRKEILIGEKIHYNIKFTFPSSDYEVLFNIPDSIPHFYLVNKTKSDSVEMGNYLVEQKMVLTSFDSGKWSIPAFQVRLQKGASVYSLNTDPVLINVRFSPEDTTGLYDIKPPIHVFVVENSWLIIAATILTILVLLFLLWQYIQRRKKREKPLFGSPQSAYREAMNSLEELGKTNLETNDKVKFYHAELSDILRRYSSRMQQSNLLNQTTGDLLLNFKRKNLGVEYLSSIAEVLRQNDAVKFAKFIPAQTDSKKSLLNMKNIIDNLQQFYKTQTQ